MTRKNTSSAMGFIMAQLEKEPALEYRVVKERAGEQGMTIYPVMYGKAKALLGLVPQRPRKRREQPEKRDALRLVAPRDNGPGLDFGDRLVRAMADIQGRATADGQKLREAIRKAIQILEDALES